MQRWQIDFLKMQQLTKQDGNTLLWAEQPQSEHLIWENMTPNLMETRSELRPDISYRNRSVTSYSTFKAVGDIFHGLNDIWVSFSQLVGMWGRGRGREIAGVAAEPISEAELKKSMRTTWIQMFVCRYLKWTDLKRRQLREVKDESIQGEGSIRRNTV